MSKKILQTISKNFLDIDLLIYDFDGVISNSENWHQQHWLTFFKSHFNIDIDMNIIHSFRGLFAQHILRETFKIYNLPRTNKDIEAAFEKWLQSEKLLLHPFFEKSKEPFFYDAACIISMFHAQKVPIVILSGGQLSTINYAISKFHGHNYIRNIITAETPHFSKNTPYPFSELKKHYDSERTLVIEDSANCIAQAKLGGCETLNVEDFNDRQYIDAKTFAEILAKGYLNVDIN